MPYAVRKFPDSLDPRDVTFNARGFDDTSTPPYLWRFVTAGATGIWSFLNNGPAVPIDSVTDDFVTWIDTDWNNAGISVGLNSEGWLIEDSPIAPQTHSFSGFIDGGGAGICTFHLHQTLPFAVQQQGPLVVAGNAAWNAAVPNALYLIPAIWDYLD